MVDSHFYSSGKKFDTLEEANRLKSQDMKKAMEILLGEGKMLGHRKVVKCEKIGRRISLGEDDKSEEAEKSTQEMHPLREYRRIELPEDDET